ncbi:MAG: hypothetical protein JWN18_107 [Parcubacteria group bacterium]|nr:hypothetical protein [Parcubacteria group bacterium]
MAKYIDGFVLPVQKKNMDAYRKMAVKGGKLWKKYGALEYFECVGDDLKPKWLPITFPSLVKTKPSETVVFSFIVFKSKKHRDSVNKKVMSDPSMNEFKDTAMPFDMQRMTYGGFKVLVEA